MIKRRENVSGGGHGINSVSPTTQHYARRFHTGPVHAPILTLHTATELAHDQGLSHTFYILIYKYVH